MGNFRYPNTPGLDANSRANLIASRLNDRGVHPEARSRVDFTREAVANQPVYHAPNYVRYLVPSDIHDVYPGQPITRAEIENAIRNRILPEDFDFSQLQRATPESINSYYTSFPSRVRDYTIQPYTSNQ